ncbi:MAG: response regulator [Deltaproteobacteria bacterium]|nr:MAG: response regulator [Deltaproteobacteria bacterium]
MSASALIIEDEPAVARLEKRILERLGFRVAVHQKAEEGYAEALAGGFDLILLDVMLEQDSGFELARRLKTEPKTRSVPIIYVTARDASDDMAEGFASGGAVYLTKPFSEKNLETAIQAVLSCDKG